MNQLQFYLILEPHVDAYHIIYENFKVNMIKKSLKVNIAGGTSLRPIGKTPLESKIDDQIFVHNFICTKLKQPLILGLNFIKM